MPVLVTAADRPLAHRLVTRLLDEGGEVRAYATSAQLANLRAAGAVVATGALDDEGRLEAAMTDVHTVVHVGGGLFSRDATVLVDAARVVATAAANAGVRRIITLSLPGADPAAAEPLRRAKGEAERLFAAVAPVSIVIRTSLVDTSAVRDALATAGSVDGVPFVPVAPVQVGDVLEVVVAFDRARSEASRGHLVVAADGPERMPIEEYLRRVGLAPPGHGSMVGRRLYDPKRQPLLVPALCGGPWWSDGDDVIDGWKFAGITPCPPTLQGPSA